MTPADAVAQALKRTRSILEAITIGTRANGKPILNPQGKPINFQPPALGDLLVQVLLNQEIILQVVALTAQGFTLSDQEADRIATLILDKAELRQNVVSNQQQDKILSID